MNDFEVINILARMCRFQRQEMASRSRRCKDLLNTVTFLHQWITSGNFDELSMFLWWDGGMATYESIKHQLCRCCYRRFFAPLQEDGHARMGDIAAARWDLRQHMASDHGATWDFMNRDMMSNSKPFL